MGRTFTLGLVVTLVSGASYIWFGNATTDANANFALLLALGTQNLCIYLYGLIDSMRSHHKWWAVTFGLFITLILAAIGYMYYLNTVFDSLFQRPWN